MRPAGQHPTTGGSTAGGNPIGTPASNLPGPAPNTAGPHSNDLLNKLDPTVDSMSGGTQVLGPGINASTHGHAPPQTSTARTAHGTTGTGPRFASQPEVGNNYGPQHNAHQAPAGGPAAPEGTYGPHSSRLANALDPRIDSDRDNRASAPMQGQNTMGHPGQNTIGHQGPVGQPGAPIQGQNTMGHQGPIGQPGAPIQGQNTMGHPGQTTMGHPGQTTMGHPGQNTMGHPGQNAMGHPGQNTMDHRGPVGPTGAASDTAAPHSSHVANVLDPRIDSDRDGAGRAPMQGHGQNTTIHQGPVVQPGPATTTAGPHRSNLLNKLDPGVDSKASVTQQREYRTS
jgi:hypothetical protein